MNLHERRKMPMRLSSTVKMRENANEPFVTSAAMTFRTLQLKLVLDRPSTVELQTTIV